MDIHKDCYSAIDLTQQDDPHRRKTVIGLALIGLVLNVDLVVPKVGPAPLLSNEHI
jgi:hypothetical protein